MEINAGTDRMTRNERRKPHNEQADPQLKSAALWGLDSAPRHAGQVCGHTPAAWCECLWIQLPFLCPGNHREKCGGSRNLLHMHPTDGQHMCDNTRQPCWARADSSVWHAQAGLDARLRQEAWRSRKKERACNSPTQLCKLMVHCDFICLLRNPALKHVFTTYIHFYKRPIDC